MTPLMSPGLGLVLLVGCSTTTTAPPQQPVLPDRAATDRVLDTMREKIAAAEELLQLQQDRAQNVETLYDAGRVSFADMASTYTKMWDARIRMLNYQQDLHVAEAAMPLIMETVREKVVAAESAVEAREELVGKAERLHEAGRIPVEDVDAVRTLLLEDRIRVLSYRQELYTAEAVFGMAGIQGGK